MEKYQKYRKENKNHQNKERKSILQNNFQKDFFKKLNSLKNNNDQIRVSFPFQMYKKEVNPYIEKKN